MRNAALVLVLTAVTASIASAANWPAWRGPSADGIATDASPPLRWSATENVKWKVPVRGESSSTPVIWGSRMFMTVAVPKGDGQDIPYDFNLVCLDRANGATLWERTARTEVPHEGHHPTGSYSAYSPVIDGTLVWALFGSRGVHCYDLDGEHQWSRDLIKMETFRRFGEGNSPVLAGDAVIVVMDHQGPSKIYAFDKLTGETRWERDRDEVTSWSTPVVLPTESGYEVITSATNGIRSYDVATGEVLWERSGLGRSVIPMPVYDENTIVFMNGFREPKLLAFAFDRSGAHSKLGALRWELDRGTSDVASPVLHEGKLYVVPAIRAALSCYDVDTGDPYYEGERLEGAREIYASPLLAGGRLYVATRQGTVSVIRPGETFEVLATNKLDDTFDGSPVAIGNDLYLKGANYLYCISEP